VTHSFIEKDIENSEEFSVGFNKKIIFNADETDFKFEDKNYNYGFYMSHHASGNMKITIKTLKNNNVNYLEYNNDFNFSNDPELEKQLIFKSVNISAISIYE
jgi:hypothetical protein